MIIRQGCIKLPPPPWRGGIESSCWGRKSSGEEGKGRREGGGKKEREGEAKREEGKGKGKGKQRGKNGRGREDLPHLKNALKCSI